MFNFEKNPFDCVVIFNKPLACFIPRSAIMLAGKSLEAKALLKMSLNSLFRPPMPISAKSQFGFITLGLDSFPTALPFNNTPEDFAGSNLI